jgi:dTDP-4-amino-4,6-dideoxygalactose transaminase
MKVPFYGHERQYLSIKKEIDDNMQEVIMSGQYILGPMLKKFEGELATYGKTKHAIGVGNGTDALWLVFMALGLKEGDELITNANTFFATAEAMWIAGCKAVLVDCDPKTKCIDPKAIEAAITPKTKAIVPVHLYGQCAPMREISAIAKKHNLFVIEDNAQAIDAKGDNFEIGELSDAVCTSFIIQKNLGTFGDAGAIFTNRDDINSRVRILRSHGSPARNVHSFGFNSRLDDLHAGILSAKLKHITAWSDQRIAWAKFYTDGLREAKSFTLPTVRPGYRHVFHLYVIETKDASKRDAFVKFLNDNGVDAKTHYSIAIHQQAGYPWGKDAEIRGSLANAEYNAAACVSLPMFPELRPEEVAYTIAKCMEWDKLNS